LLFANAEKYLGLQVYDGAVLFYKVALSFVHPDVLPGFIIEGSEHISQKLESARALGESGGGKEFTWAKEELCKFQNFWNDLKIARQSPSSTIV
jgi:hypothetical protein